MTAEILGWTAAVGVVVAALMTAANYSRRVTGLGWVLFTVTAVLWVAAGFLQDQWNLVFQNAILLCINAYGAYRWWWLSEGEGRTARHVPRQRPRHRSVAERPRRTEQPARARAA